MAITPFFKTSLLRLLWLVALLATTVRCAQVIGIEEATCNPSLPECHATAASNVMSSGGTASSLCTDYCTTVMGVCTGGFAVYGGLESCLAVCKTLPEGQPGDDQVNTVQCRLAQARFASKIAEPSSLYCAAAGPGGNDHCGSNCAGLCSIMAGACTGANQQYTAESDCVTACNAVPTLDGGYNVVDRVMSNGNSRQCRLWHASVATLDPRTHCVHAAGQSPCK
jgi:hypothetical protein